jgi:hypothetical protein
VIFGGDRGAEERHDAVPEPLVDGAFVAVHGVHHALQRGSQEALGGFGGEVAAQLGGAFQVGKQHGHLLALAFQGAFGRRELSWVCGRWGCTLPRAMAVREASRRR